MRNLTHLSFLILVLLASSAAFGQKVYLNPSDQTGNAEQRVPVTSGQAQQGTPRASQKDQRPDHGKDPE